jgi:threonine-phosphate decarboxylase
LLLSSSQNTFKTADQSILKNNGVFVVTDFPRRDVHGGTGKRQREKTKRNILDFSASINPFPPRFSWHIDISSLGEYPDDSYSELKEQISCTFHRSPQEICVGNGSIELIRIFCSVMLKGNKKFFTESHTFGEYALSARLAGAHKTGRFRESDVSFICNPNNPTGVLRKKDDMIRLLEDSKSHGGVLFCDEAFIELSDPSQSMVDMCDPGLFVLHSLTKSFSVPGIRFGYGFGDPDLIEKIEITRPPWSVNAFAESYAILALRHWDDLAESRAALAIEREFLATGIGSLGLRSNPSAANYILVECDREVSSLCHCLAQKNILVRDCTSFGLPTCIRISVRTRDENQILLEALSSCMP